MAYYTRNNKHQHRLILNDDDNNDDDDDRCTATSFFRNICILFAWLLIFLFLLTIIAMVIGIYFIDTEHKPKANQFINQHQPEKRVIRPHTTSDMIYRNFTHARQAYLRKMYQVKQALFRANSMCKLNLQLMKINQYDLLKLDRVLDHDDDVLNIIIPLESVVLNPCLGNCSYTHRDCKPTISHHNKTKEITVMIYNATQGCVYPVLRKFHVDEKCICQP